MGCLTKPQFGPSPRERRPLLGKRLRVLRTSRYPDNSIRSVAEMVGISGPYLSSLELARVPPPSLEVLISLASVLGTNPLELVLLAGYKAEEKRPNKETDDLEISKSHAMAYSVWKLSKASRDAGVSSHQFMCLLLGAYLPMQGIISMNQLVDVLERTCKALRSNFPRRFLAQDLIQGWITAGDAALNLCNQVPTLAWQIRRGLQISMDSDELSSIFNPPPPPAPKRRKKRRKPAPTIGTRVDGKIPTFLPKR
jgi:transcriptional regulator with XRE-family HTH domain